MVHSGSQTASGLRPELRVKSISLPTSKMNSSLGKILKVMSAFGLPTMLGSIEIELESASPRKKNNNKFFIFK